MDKTRTPPQAAGQEQPALAANKTFPCGSCGAKLVFQPGLRALKCQYCGAETPIPQADAPAQTAALEKLDFDHWVQVAPEEPEIPRQKIKCPQCSASTELAQNVVSDKCAFCGAPAVATAAVAARKIKPQAVAPFEFKERDARERFTGWVKGLWFAPSALKKLARIDKGLKGTYIPYFTYDSDTYTTYTGERGIAYTEHETVTVNGKQETREVRRVRWTPVSGAVQVQFADLAVVASRSVPAEHAEALAPWDLGKLAPFSDSYLSGFVVEAYQQGLRSGAERARAMMEPEIRRAIEQDIGGDEQRIHSKQTRYSDNTFRHLLLPLWVAAYQYSGKTYRFLVNGQTGLVRGERPWSVWKIAFAVIAAGLAAYGLYRLTH